MSDKVSTTQEIGSTASSAVERAKEYGIDITLLIENLRRSPTERLRRHRAMVEFVQELRRAGRKRQDSAGSEDRHGGG